MISFGRRQKLRASRRKASSVDGRRLRCEELEQRIALTSLPPGFAETTVVSGLTDPTSMALAPDGRLFITEQTGSVRVFKNGTLLPAPFVNLSVDNTDERGLLGLAFDPNFSTNHFVYVYYTTSAGPVHNRVSRFTANGDVAAPGETVLLDLDNLSFATRHNGGALHFGLDGKLYIAVGENGTASNSQTLNNMLGKILRINTDGSIPTDNPFFNTATGNNRSIWALGLRNPFTFAVQPGTGRMFINDVGQATWEEINEGQAGANYGWPNTEGPTSDPSFVSPLFAYNHDIGCAITGGDFYNPPTRQFPMGYQGDYFFADLCGDWIHRYDPVTGEVSEFATDTPSGVVDIDVMPDGSLLYLSRGLNEIQRVTFSANGPSLAVAPGPGMQPRVRVLEAATGIEQFSFLAYDAGFNGGVRVAMGDVNDDGVDDVVTAAGPGGGPHVRIFDGVTGHVLREFFAYDAGFRGGVFVAVKDINGDERADIVTGAGAGGGPHVKVFSGLNGAVLGSFFTYNADFGGGVEVAVGNVDGDGAPEIITGAGPGGGPHVRVFRLDGTEHPSFPGGRFAYNADFTGGVFVAAGDVDGDGKDEIITGPGAGGGPHVRVFDQSWSVVSEFFAYDANFTGGVRVAAMDLNNDQHLEVLTAAGPGGGPHVKAFSVPSLTQRASFFAFDFAFTGGVFIAGDRWAPPPSTPPLFSPSLSAAAVDQAFEQEAPDGDHFLCGCGDDDSWPVVSPTIRGAASNKSPGGVAKRIPWPLNGGH